MGYVPVGVELPGMEQRVDGVVVAAVLMPHDEQDRLATDQRIGDQRLPPEGGQFVKELGNPFPRGHVAGGQGRFHFGQATFVLAEALDVSPVPPRKRAAEVLDRQAQGRPLVSLAPGGDPPACGSEFDFGEVLSGGLGVDPPLGREIVEVDVPPPAPVVIDDSQKCLLADQLRRIPGHPVHGLGEFPPGLENPFAVECAEGHVRVGMAAAADQQRHRRPGQLEHRRLDNSGHSIVRPVVGKLDGRQVVLSLLVVFDVRMVVERGPVGDDLPEPALDDLPALQIAALEIEDHPGRLGGRRRRRHGRDRAAKRGREHQTEQEIYHFLPFDLLGISLSGPDRPAGPWRTRFYPRNA